MITKSTQQYQERVTMFVINKAKFMDKLNTGIFDQSEYGRLIDEADKLNLTASKNQLEAYSKHYAVRGS